MPRIIPVYRDDPHHRWDDHGYWDVTSALSVPVYWDDSHYGGMTVITRMSHPP